MAFFAPFGEYIAPAATYQFQAVRFRDPGHNAEMYTERVIAKVQRVKVIGVFSAVSMFVKLVDTLYSCITLSGWLLWDDASTFQYYFIELYFQHFYERKQPWSSLMPSKSITRGTRQMSIPLAVPVSFILYEIGPEIDSARLLALRNKVCCYQLSSLHIGPKCALS